MSSTQQLLLGEGAVNVIPAYIEEVFSTWLFDTNTPSDVTIPNGINLSGNGGLVWNKLRSDSAAHQLYDTERGGSNQLQSNTTNAQSSSPPNAVQFGSNGFTWLRSGGWGPNSVVSWTFREQPKFFDIVTYTGDGTNNRAISHNLGSTPGFIIAKRTNSALSWFCYHTSLGVGKYITLNQTAASVTNADAFPAVSSTTFTPVNDANVIGLNTNGDTYVAYLFAHDAGGFGLTGTNNVISCGSFTADGSGNATINLGYEPQWVMYKCSSNAGTDWEMNDTMRGLSLSTWRVLWANLSNAEADYDSYIATQGITPNSTGFSLKSAGAGRTFIYIAIRRGPMQVPTLGTTVFSPVARSGTGTTASTITAGFAPDLHIVEQRQAGGNGTFWRNKFVGMLLYNQTTSNREEFIPAADFTETFSNTGVSIPTGSNSNKFNYNGYDYVNWMFGRAPSVFDIVCYTGTGANTTFTHNLGVIPELIFVKRRDASAAWDSYSSALANTAYIVLDSTAAQATGATRWNSTTPTSSVFSVGTSTTTNASAGTYVAYLFATCAGVSKVGSYTGTGALQTVNCGFTTGARFVLIKRTDSTGNWWVYDSARGITAGNDPYLFLNALDTEVTNTNYVDTDTTGFKVTAAAPAELNANGGTYIFLAFA